MKKFLISKVRKEFYELNNTKENCQDYIKVALEENGMKELKKGELGGCLNELSQNSEDILSMIKEQERIIEKKSIYFILPKFFINSILVKIKTKKMKKHLVDYIQDKSQYSFEEYSTKVKK